MLVQSPGKFLCAIRNLVTKISKIRNITLIFQNFQKRKKNYKIHIHSEKSINSFNKKKGSVT